MHDILTEAQFREVLREACKAAGSQKAWAEAKGFHPSFIGDVLKGRRVATDRLLKILRAEWRIVMERKSD